MKTQLECPLNMTIILCHGGSSTNGSAGIGIIQDFLHIQILRAKGDGQQLAHIRLHM